MGREMCPLNPPLSSSRSPSSSLSHTLCRLYLISPCRLIIKLQPDWGDKLLTEMHKSVLLISSYFSLSYNKALCEFVGGWIKLKAEDNCCILEAIKSRLSAFINIWRKCFNWRQAAVPVLRARRERESSPLGCVWCLSSAVLYATAFII